MAKKNTIPIFDRDILMKQSLKYVDANRQKLRNDRPFKYWALNQDLYINITVFMWMVWQAWSLSAIFSIPNLINESFFGFDFYIQTVFWKIGTLQNALQQNADIIAVLWRPEAFVYIVYTVILFFLTIYTIVVANHYVSEIKQAIKINKVRQWHWKINLFLIISHGLIFYGLLIFSWILFSLFYIPNAQASVGFNTLIFHVSAKKINEIDVYFIGSGYALFISVIINLISLTSLYIYYLHQRFVGYRYFFSFEKKEWKKIDYVGQNMKMFERKKLTHLNKAHRGTFKAVNNPDCIIEIKDVNKYFLNGGLKFHALKNVSLKIKEGEFVVILGPSGSGKTTLLNIISGVDRPTSGEIVVANYNIIKMSAEKLTRFRRDKTGYIFQQYSLLPNLTVKENIMIGYYLGQSRKRKLDQENFYKQLKTAKGIEKVVVILNRAKSLLKSDVNKNKVVDKIIDVLGISMHANKYPSQLSGGQQQRVAIARAFVKNPDILFGDEPTGAIDVQMSKQILELFHLINSISKTTVLMVTHNPLIAQMATRIIEVHNGIITRNEINNNPKKVQDINWH